MIACCGLDCAKCDALIATERDDDSMRETVAKKWAEMYEAPLKAADIVCTGCRSSGVRFVYCESMCEIRKCVVGRGHETCAECPDLACELLEALLKQAPQARENLNARRRGG